VRARFKLLYDPAAPATLKARVLPDLARAGLLPPNDLASFLEDAAPSIRAAALLSLNVKKALPADLQLAVLDRLSDSAPEVREAAMAAIVPLQLRAAIPRLLAIAADSHSPDRTAAMEALCGIPDPRALSVYLEAIQDRDPHLRRSGETALVAIRDKVRGPLMSRLATAAVSDPARLTIERAVARFEPVRSWRAIGPFPRTTAPMFVGELAIDFGRAHSGVLGQSVSWAVRAADPATGRVDLSDLKRGAGDQGGFGYDGNGSPDLCAFAYTELIADHAGPALLLVGSSGTLIVHVNDQAVYTYANLAGRDFAPDTDVARIELAQGKNRIVVLCRQGIGPWCFSLQVARAQPGGDGVHRGVAGSVNTLREHALAHDGDPQRGEALFFDARGIGCGRCHAAAGRGTATIGPDLTGLAAKFDRAEVIRSVLEPSSRIATGYQPVVVATRDGKVTSGVVRSETETMLELADAEARITKVPKSDIDVRRVGEVSIMPSKLVEALSPAEFADLVSYLLSLKQPQAAGSSQDRR
jgi:putative heme-binding domain-containing protein